MSVTDVKDTLDMAAVITGVDQVKVLYKSWLLSDNAPRYLLKDLKKCIWKIEPLDTSGEMISDTSIDQRSILS